MLDDRRHTLDRHRIIHGDRMDHILCISDPEVSFSGSYKLCCQFLCR